MLYVNEVDGTATEDERTALAAAIGRVAMRSANSDDTLRFLISDLAETNDPGWIIFEGQSTDWLVGQSQALLRSIEESPGSTPLDAELRTALGRVAGVAKLRNEVVHGVWTTASNFDDARCRPRPFGSGDTSELVWYCHRSRFQRFEPPRRWTASDVDRVAATIEESRVGAATAFARQLVSHSTSGEIAEVWAAYL